jgi:hypothetical protein
MYKQKYLKYKKKYLELKGGIGTKFFNKEQICINFNKTSLNQSEIEKTLANVKKQLESKIPQNQRSVNKQEYEKIVLDIYNMLSNYGEFTLGPKPTNLTRIFNSLHLIDEYIVRSMVYYLFVLDYQQIDDEQNIAKITKLKEKIEDNIKIPLDKKYKNKVLDIYNMVKKYSNIVTKSDPQTLFAIYDYLDFINNPDLNTKLKQKFDSYKYEQIDNEKNIAKIKQLTYYIQSLLEEYN